MQALLANEAGGGRGHVTTLAAAARALPPGMPCLAALGRLIYADELAGLADPIVKAPLLARPRDMVHPLGLLGGATWGDVLAQIGLADPHKVARGLAFWRSLIVEHDVSLLIADFAPLAVRAALALRDEGWAIRIVTLGTGYTSPPAGLDRFPVHLPDFSRVTHAEDATCATLNQDPDLSPLPRLTALYDVDRPLATTFGFLDPYARPAHDRIPPLVPASRDLASDDGIFVYFSTAELTDPALVAALAALPQPRRGYIPSAAPEVRDRLAASGMEVLDRPASADEIAQYARLIVHAAPHGTTCLAALAGVAQFGVPQHLEQLFNARKAADAGILTHAMRGDPDLADRISAAYSDVRLTNRACDLARNLRASHPADPLAPLAHILAKEAQALT
ncbi:hypothetical protein [Tabrizicola aquatica]|uniref:hypothetical protein n=1 Tax=Tabrizicola aquatica TaxID=909926 RepID=UPI000CD0BA0E|nr:hypothetical protein [Tabrizicola aquatica]